MKYALLKTYENGKLTECPICHNEETNIEGDFCQICGITLVNSCFNRDCSAPKILPSNARYCPICGHESLFYHKKILKDWNYNEFKPISDGFFNIPDGIDEELPFN